MPFVNSFVTYLLLVVLFVIAAGIGIAVGIHLRKKKDDKTPDASEEA